MGLTGVDERTQKKEMAGVEKRTQEKTAPRPQPPYNVILLDDDDHTYEYVIDLLRKLFGHTFESAFQVAEAVDRTGRVVLLTTTLEHAEFKQGQIHAFGRDWRLTRSQGCMSCILEPAE